MDLHHVCAQTWFHLIIITAASSPFTYGSGSVSVFFYPPCPLSLSSVAEGRPLVSEFQWNIDSVTITTKLVLFVMSYLERSTISIKQESTKTFKECELSLNRVIDCVH